MAADARRFGLDEESVAAVTAEAARSGSDDQEGVWPDNWDIVQAFLAVDTQWRAASIGGGMAAGTVLWIGLDYAAVRAGLDAIGIPVTPALWSGLREMEGAAREALNEAGR